MVHQWKVRYTCSGCGVEKLGNRKFFEGKPYCKACVSIMRQTDELKESLKILKMDSTVGGEIGGDINNYIIRDEKLAKGCSDTYIAYYYCAVCGVGSKSRNDVKTHFIQVHYKNDGIDRNKVCRVLGTCDILQVHHDLFKDDPNRLTTDFLVEQICGEDKLKEYKKHKLEQKVE